MSAEKKVSTEAKIRGQLVTEQTNSTEIWIPQEMRKGLHNCVRARALGDVVKTFSHSGMFTYHMGVFINTSRPPTLTSTGGTK